MKKENINLLPANIEHIPSSYKQKANQQGKLEELYYDTYESDTYDQKTTPLKKRAIVYLPYGYENLKNLDVCILMHGGWSDETTILGTTKNPSILKSYIDHLIEENKICPMILVCPTYNNLSDHDSWDYSLAIRLTDQWHNELENDLLPAIARTYKTAAKSDKRNDLIKARDHFSFGGFSMGSVTTWRTFEHSLAFFRTFMPSSGNIGYSGKQMADFVRRQGYDANDFYILAMTGTKDFAAQSFLSQLEDMAEVSSMFDYSETGNMQVRIQTGNSHDANAMYEYFYNDLMWLGQGDTVEDSHVFTLNSTVSEVIQDPSFNGFGRLLFPVNSGYMYGNRLEDLDFAWYSEIDPDKTVEICNYRQEQVLAGQKIFYNIYTEEEMKKNPALRNTGLFFFKGVPNAPFAIVNAGGGFAYVAAMHDSFPQALELSKMGLNGFALIYRPGAQTACEDLSRAIELIFEHANELEVNTDGYSLWGGSAGGRMSVWVSEFGTA